MNSKTIHLGKKQKPSTALIYEGVCRQLLLLKKVLVGKEIDRFEPVWIEARNSLDSLPLPSDEYHLALARIGSCYRYGSSHELGAALYELRLLIQQIQLSVEPG